MKSKSKKEIEIFIRFPKEINSQTHYKKAQSIVLIQGGVHSNQNQVSKNKMKVRD